MTMPHRRVVITLGGLIGLAMAIGWLFYFPFSEARLYRGAAPHAALISEHERLAERWSDLLANPQLAGILDATLGAQDPTATRAALELLGNPTTTRLVELLGKRKVVVSYVPRASPRGFDCWTASAWVGGTTQLLRWGWLDRTLGELKPTLRARGIKGWQQPLLLDGQRYHLGMVAFEGVVALTLSRDPGTVTWMATRLLRDAPMTTVNGLARPTDVGTAAPDRVALRPARLPVRRALPGTLRADLATCNANGLDLNVTWRSKLAAPALPCVMLPDLPLPATMPAALACSSVSNLTTLLEELLPPATTQLLRPLLALAQPDSPLAVALGTTAYSGRLLGVRTPALIACARAGIPPEALPARVRSLVDRLVAAAGTGLIVSESKTRPHMLVVSLAQNPTLAMLGRADVCAIAMQAGWLYISSNPAMLATCLAELERGEATFDGQRIWAGQPAAVALWVNAAPATETIANGVAVYNLMTIVGAANGRRLDSTTVTQMLDLAATLGEGRAWCTSTDGALTTRLRIQ